MEEIGKRARDEVKPLAICKQPRTSDSLPIHAVLCGPLPFDCWAEVLGRLPPAQLARLASTCRIWNELASSDTIWIHHCRAKFLLPDILPLESKRDRYIRHVKISRIEDAVLGRNGRPQNISAAVAELAVHADNGDHRAAVCLGVYIRAGCYVQPLDMGRSQHYLSSSLHPIAQWYCMVYKWQQRSEALPAKSQAEQWKDAFQQLVSQTDPDDYLALCAIAYCYLLEVGVPANPQYAYELICQSSRSGYAEAQYHRGQCLARGLGCVNPSESEARVWYERAAAQGHQHAREAIRLLEGPQASFVEERSNE